MVARVVAVKSLVLIEEVVFCQEAAVYVTIFEIDGALPLIVRIGQLLSSGTA